MFGVGVSKFAGLLDQLFRPDVSTPGFVRTAHFHAPFELGGEATAAGFELQADLGIEGPGWLLTDFDRRWDDRADRQMILATALASEVEPSLRGVHAHFLAVARNPAR